MGFTARLFTLAVIALSFASISQAQTKECEFVPRSELGDLLSAMPSNVLGWVSCKKSSPQAGVFMVVKAKLHSEADLEETVKEIARTTDARDFHTHVAWVSKQALEHRQIVLETSGEKNETVISHFAFVGQMDDANTYVFVHSMYDREAHEIHNALDHIHTVVSRAEFLTNLWASEQVHVLVAKPTSDSHTRAL